MIKILDLAKEKLLKKQELFFCRHQDNIYLLARGKKIGGIDKVFKSSDGFNFTKHCFEKLPLKLEFYPKIRKKKQEFLDDRYHHLLVYGSEYITPDELVIENVFPDEDDKLLTFFHYQKDAKTEVGVVGFSKGKDPQLLWRHTRPVWQMDYFSSRQKPTFLELVKFDDRYLAYWLIDGIVRAIVYPNYRIDSQIKIRKKYHLKKPEKNPVLKPQEDNDWEAFNTFNPAAIYEAGKVHIFYRAQGFDYVSSVGYATSRDGLTVDERLEQPIFVPTESFESTQRPGQLTTAYSSGGCGGCEDPRVTRVGDRIYMTYVAFDGVSEPRIALTSISLEDFLDRNWLWRKPVLISPPGAVDKSACILPEKIDGQYVIFHRIFPNILIDYVDSLDFSSGQYLEGQYKIEPRPPMWWDSRKIGAGAPPLRTKDGWLLIYQSVDDKEGHRYKVGAMLLDLNNPTQVLYRSSNPIIEPDQWYDNEGFKAGVVYPCGAVIIGDTLFVYYGGADSYVCVATADLEEFLEQLKTSGDVKLEKTMIRPKPKKATKETKTK